MTRSRSGGGSVVVGILALLAARPVQAQDTYVWCVGERDQDPWFDCGVDVPCANAVDFATVDEAMGAASAASAGPDAAHFVCIGAAQLQPFRQRVVIDLQATPIEGDLSVYFVAEGRATTLCADPASEANEPMIEARGRVGTGRALGFSRVRSREDACGGVSRPLLRLQDTNVGLTEFRVSGGSDPVVEVVAAGQETSVTVSESRFDGARAPVFLGAGSLLVGNSELSDNAPPSGSALLDWSGDLRFDRSALAGNVTTAAPLVRHRGSVDIGSSTIAGNVAIGAPLLELDARAPRPAFHGIRATTVSRNVTLASGTATPRDSLPRPFRAVDPEEFCLPAGSDEQRYLPREQPAWTGMPGGVFVRLRREGSNDAFSILKSYVVQNTFGGSAGTALVAPVDDADVTLTLLHNLIDGDTPLLRVDAGPRHRIVGARNIFLDAQPVVAGELRHAELTGDFVAAGNYDGVSFEAGLAGPALGAAPFAARSESEGLALSACAQVELHCPDVLGDCTRLGNDMNVCALDAAVAYVPTDAWLAAAALPFPWSGDFFADFDGGPGAVPGPAGWTCDDEAALPFDRDEREGLPRGDADGYTNITDCDNEDVAVVPRLPDGVALTSDPCGDDEGVCYRCPDAPPDPPPDPPAAQGPLVGCGPRGCGTPIVPAFFLPILAGCRRRPRPRRG